MDILTVQNSIISELESVITDLKIEAFPDAVNEYKLKHPKGAILVQYTGSNFYSTHSCEGIQQIENMQFALTLMVKNLYSTTGAYAHVNAIKSALTGFLVSPKHGKAFLTDIKFLDEISGTWIYGLNLLIPAENYE